jgi:hypothetical protein
VPGVYYPAFGDEAQEAHHQADVAHGEIQVFEGVIQGEGFFIALFEVALVALSFDLPPFFVPRLPRPLSNEQVQSLERGFQKAIAEAKLSSDRG